MPEEAKTRRHPRVSSIWIVPAVALAIGAWMLISGLLKRDATITIRFDSAQGISANRTKIKARSVDIGTVESIRLSEDFSQAIVTARIDHDATNLLREEARFWVIRPQIGTRGITGVGTLISGVYIEMDPRGGKPGRRSFEGLGSPPVTASEVGLRLKLNSASVGGVHAADPVLYRGRPVGKVLSSSFDPESQRFTYEIHVEAPFDQAVSSNTRFWKASAFSLEAGTEGFSFSAESIESIIAGGISFDLPKNSVPSKQAESGNVFNLYSNYSEINKYPYNHYVEYLLLFTDSVRGLFPEASVEYRGIKVGHVVDVSFEYLEEQTIIGGDEIPVPALVRLYPGHLDMEDSAESAKALQEIIEKRVANGLRADLRYASFLTQSLYVSLDYFRNIEPAEIGTFGEYRAFPTQESGIELLEQKVSEILEQISSLPLQETIADIRKTSQTASETLDALSVSVANLNRILDTDATRELPQRLADTLEQIKTAMAGLSEESSLYRGSEDAMQGLERAIKQFERLLRDVENKPSSLLFSRPAKPDPIPRAPKDP